MLSRNRAFRQCFRGFVNHILRLRDRFICESFSLDPDLSLVCYVAFSGASKGVYSKYLLGATVATVPSLLLIETYCWLTEQYRCFSYTWADLIQVNSLLLLQKSTHVRCHSSSLNIGLRSSSPYEVLTISHFSFLGTGSSEVFATHTFEVKTSDRPLMVSSPLKTVKTQIWAQSVNQTLTDDSLLLRCEHEQVSACRLPSLLLCTDMQLAHGTYPAISGSRSVVRTIQKT